MIHERRQRQLRRQNVVRLISFVGILIAFLLLILKIDNMLLTFAIAFVISYLLSPLVSYLERTGLSRALSAFLIFFAISILLGFSVKWFIPVIGDQLVRLKAELPNYVEGLSRLLTDRQDRFRRLVGGAINIDLAEQVRIQVTESASHFFSVLPALLSSLVSALILAPFIAFFMIKDGRQITNQLLRIVPNSIFEPVLSLVHQINQQMGQFVRARLLESAFVGVVTLVGLLVLGFPFSPLLALFAAVTNLIPYVGPVIGALPTLGISLINGDSSMQFALVLMVYAVAQLIDTVFIIPLVVAKIVDLHPVTVVIAIIVGFQFLGVLGMLISIPVASVIKVTLGTVYRILTDVRDSY